MGKPVSVSERRKEAMLDQKDLFLTIHRRNVRADLERMFPVANQARQTPSKPSK